MININELDFEKTGGLIPAIILDNSTGQVLMLGFMNKESLDVTLKEKKVTFFSRSKQRLWTKGETSGNYLNLVDIKSDCDNDTLLIYAEPDGPTCHTGSYSCFGIDKKEFDFLPFLFDFIKKRKAELPENSYTTTLFKTGTARIAQKVGEEGVETAIAAMKHDKEEIINESADLIYHLFVLLAEQDIEFSDVIKKLEERHK